MAELRYIASGNHYYGLNLAAECQILLQGKTSQEDMEDRRSEHLQNTHNQALTFILFKWAWYILTFSQRPS